MQLGAPPASLDVSSTLQGSPTVTTPVARKPVSTATNTQRRQSLLQNNIPPPRRRDSQPHATASDAEAVPAPDPIAESAAKDNKKLIRRLVNLLEEFNETLQVAEQNFNLVHNAKGGTIRMPDMAHHQAIYQEVSELLKGESNIELLRFQEATMKVNQIIVVSEAVRGCYALT